MPTINVYVYERSGRNSLYLGYRDPATGKQFSKSAGTRNRREAERRAARWEDEVNRFGSSDGSMLWDDFVELYDRRHLSQLRESASEAAHSSLRIFHRFAEPRTVGDVSSGMIADWLADYRQERSEATVRSRLGAVRAALNWAADLGVIGQAPRIPRQRKSGKRNASKGRPIEAIEFARLLRSCSPVVGKATARQWRRNLRCLWLSGLRLSEAVNLSWDDPLCICPDFSHSRPMLRIPGDANKDNDDHLVPITPDWAAWLERVPAEARTGRVLVWPKQKLRAANTERQLVDFASKTITAIGKESGVIVNTRSGKHASAHDLRRSFGARWSRQLMPQVLQLLMRHDDISTTMRYYVGSDVQHAAEAVWNA